MRKLLMIICAAVFAAAVYAQDEQLIDETTVTPVEPKLTFQGFVKAETAVSVDQLRESEYLKVDMWFSLVAKHSVNNYSFYVDVSGRYDALNKRDGKIDLREAYITADYGKFIFQAGKQWIAWGRADEINPVDMINPENYSEIIIPSKDERKIRVPSVKATWKMSDTFDLTGVFVPVFTKPILPENAHWQNNSYRMVQDIKNYYITEGIAVQDLEYWELEDYVAAHVMEDVPGDQVNRTQLGFRLNGSVADTDFSLYYYEGYWTDLTSPAVRVTNLHQPLSGLTSLPLVPETFEMQYPWFTMLGLDWERTIGAFGLRMEGAYYFGRELAFDTNVIQEADSMPDMIALLNAYNAEEGSRKTDVVKAVIGIDRFWGNFYINAQYIVDYIVDYTELIGNDQYEDSLTFKMSDKFMEEKLVPEIKFFYEITENDLYCSPGLEYEVTDGVKVYAAADIFTGNIKGNIGQYQNADQVRFSIKYNF